MPYVSGNAQTTVSRWPKLCKWIFCLGYATASNVDEAYQEIQVLKRVPRRLQNPLSEERRRSKNAYIGSKTRLGRLEGPRPWMSLDVMAQAATCAPNDSDLKRSEIDGVLCGYVTTLPHLMLATLSASASLEPEYAHSIQVGKATRRDADAGAGAPSCAPGAAAKCSWLRGRTGSRDKFRTARFRHGPKSATKIFCNGQPGIEGTLRFSTPPNLPCARLQKRGLTYVRTALTMSLLARQCLV
jgi:hypothetical protein